MTEGNIMVIISIIIYTAVILWAVSRKLREGKMFDIVALGTCGLAITMNGTLLYMYTNGIHVPPMGEFVLRMTKLVIVPLAYMYFTRQMGRPYNNAVLFLIWMMALVGTAPGCILLPDGDSSCLGSMTIKPHRLYLIRGGRILLNIHIADFTIALQALLSVFRVVPMISVIRKYGLKMTSRMRYFTIWWLFVLLFIAYSSTLSVKELSTPAGQWFYFGLLFIFTSVAYYMLGIGLDSNPFSVRELSRKEKDEEEMESQAGSNNETAAEEVRESMKIDAFIRQYHDMAEKVRKLVYEDKAYLNPEFNTEDAIRAIGTNRTYFARMMQAEFGCKFTDILNDLRLDYARALLMTTDKTVADIAAESGFSGASYLSRKFSAKYGVSPTEFRK